MLQFTKPALSLEAKFTVATPLVLPERGDDDNREAVLLDLEQLLVGGFRSGVVQAVGADARNHLRVAGAFDELAEAI